MLMTRGTVRLAVLILSAVNAGGAAGVQVDGVQLPGITGRIVDAVGCPLIVALKLRPGTSPLEGALQEAQSDMDGRFAFANVAPGEYWIHYELLHNGGSGRDRVVVTTAGAHKEFRWLTPSPSPYDFKDRDFVVTDSEGAPIAGANIAWRRFSGAIDGPSCGEDLVTDNDGRAIASNSPPGAYRVVVEANGYERQSRDVKFGSAYSDTLTIRLLTPTEADRASRTIIRMCESPAPPDTMAQATAAADAIVIGRIGTALLDPHFAVTAERPSVLTRYDVQLLEVIKPHARLAANAARVAVVHFAGEFDWGHKVFLGCNRETMRAGETFVLFLTWSERVHAFMPMGGNTLLANITSGEVAPIRASFSAGAIVTAAKGQTAARYVRNLKAALTNPR
jgi:Carboxypeptidase regulatory-like domain